MVCHLNFLQISNTQREKTCSGVIFQSFSLQCLPTLKQLWEQGKWDKWKKSEEREQGMGDSKSGSVATSRPVEPTHWCS